MDYGVEVSAVLRKGGSWSLAMGPPSQRLLCWFRPGLWRRDARESQLGLLALSLGCGLMDRVFENGKIPHVVRVNLKGAPTRDGQLGSVPGSLTVTGDITVECQASTTELQRWLTEAVATDIVSKDTTWGVRISRLRARALRIGL
jgi:hypothetical protein